MDQRLLIFISLFLVFSLWEIISPLRKTKNKKRYRWFDNILLIFLGNLSLKILFPLGLVPFANGESNQSVIGIVLFVILLDFLIYIQHILSHKVNFLWRFHRIHHSDSDMDLTTAIRFHPLEIVFSFLYKLFFVYIFSIPIEAILIFEILLSSMALFNHSNIKLPRQLDELMQLILVTPKFHTIHHSCINSELNSNYGFNLSIWDRIFRTYKHNDIDSINIGLKSFDQKEGFSIFDLLIYPLKLVRK